MGQSSTVGSSPMSIPLSEHVMRLIHMAPDATSLNRWADTMEDPIIWMGSWFSASSGEMPVTILRGLSPHRDQVISANPGRGVGGWLLDCLSWHNLPGRSGLCSHVGDSSGLWPWPSPTMGCWEGPSWTSLAGSAVATFSLSGFLCWSGWHDFHPIRGWDVF